MTTITTRIPCRQPKVTIEPHEVTRESDGHPWTKHLVTCRVPGCDFTYDAAVGSDASDQAKWHRNAHRSFVPWTEVSGPTVNLNFSARCACGWRTGRGVSTRSDVEASLANHLTADHGLVVCR